MPSLTWVKMKHVRLHVGFPAGLSSFLELYVGKGKNVTTNNFLPRRPGQAIAAEDEHSGIDQQSQKRAPSTSSNRVFKCAHEGR